MSATKRPTAVTGLRRGVGTVPQVRSDESIGRQEDIGSLVPGWHGKNVSDMTEAEMQAMAGATPAARHRALRSRSGSLSTSTRHSTRS